MPMFGPTASRTARDVVDDVFDLVVGVDDLQFLRAVHLDALKPRSTTARALLATSLGRSPPIHE